MKKKINLCIQPASNFWRNSRLDTVVLEIEN